MRFRLTTHLFIWLILIAFQQPVSAQNKLQQQYNRYFKIPLSTRQRVDSINKFAGKNYRLDYDFSYTMVQKARKLAAAENYTEGETESRIVLGIIEEARGNFSAAQQNLSTAILKLEPKGNSALLARAYTAMGWLQRRFFKRGEAMAYTLKGLKMAEKLGDKAIIGRAYNIIAILHAEQENYALALKYHSRALAVRQQLGDKLAISISYGNIGIVYADMKKYDMAIAYHKRSLEVIKGLDELAREAFIYNDLGSSSLYKGDPDQAIVYLEKSISMREALNEKNELAYTYNYLGEAYNKKHDFKAAEFWIKKALSTAIAIGNTKQHYEGLESLSDFYASNKRYDSAYVYLHNYKIYGDSVKKIEKANQVRELTTRYETEKKEQQIKILTQQNTLQQLQIWQRNIFLVAALAFIVLAALAGYQYLSRRKAQQQVLLQQEINNQQEITAREVLNAEERERRRMASDLHDGVGQLLSAALLALNRLGAGETDNRQLAGQSLALVSESYDEVRTLSHQIIPNALLKYGLTAAVRDFLSKIDEKLIKISLETAGLTERLDEQVETILYRVIQESVNNVIKHAAASKLSIQLVKDQDGLNLTIEDNGRGFDKALLQQASGIGMKNIESRVSFLKGSVDIQSAPGEGTLIAIFVPM